MALLWFLVWFSITIIAVIMTKPARDWRLGALWLPLVVITACFPLGQTLRRDEWTYPFSSWTMYSRVRPTLTYWLYMAVDAKGTEREFPFSAIAYSEPRALAAKLDSRLRACQCREGDLSLDTALSSLATVARYRGKGDVTAVRVYRYRLDDPREGPRKLELAYRWAASR